jgi:hypothetical protein
MLLFHVHESVCDKNDRYPWCVSPGGESWMWKISMKKRRGMFPVSNVWPGLPRPDRSDKSSQPDCILRIKTWLMNMYGFSNHELALTTVDITCAMSLHAVMRSTWNPIILANCK